MGRGSCQCNVTIITTRHRRYNTHRRGKGKRGTGGGWEKGKRHMLAPPTKGTHTIRSHQGKAWGHGHTWATTRQYCKRGRQHWGCVSCHWVEFTAQTRQMGQGTQGRQVCRRAHNNKYTQGPKGRLTITHTHHTTMGSSAQEHCSTQSNKWQE